MHKPVNSAGGAGLDRSYRFGDFVLDLAGNRLSYGDQPIHLAKRAFDVLVLLVQHAGHTVDKDQLFSEVWHGLFVEENNLARHISVIRKALHAFEPDQEYIVTVAGRGYRFVADIAEGNEHADRRRQDVAAALVTRTAVSADHPKNAQASKRLRLIASAAAVILSVVGGALLVAPALDKWRIRQPSVSAEPAARPLRQVTSVGTVDDDPAWSPDGRTLAFASDRSGNLDVWIQRVDDQSPIQITFDPAVDAQPTWSPDGRFLAFYSGRDGGGIFVVSPSVGVVRRVTSFGHAPQWSPDGKRLLFMADPQRGHSALYVVDATGGMPAEVRPDLLSHVSNLRAGWHPDGRISVYARHPSDGWNLWTMLLTDGEWRRSALAPDVVLRLQRESLQLSRFAWSPDARQLYFVGRSGERDDIWRVGIEPETLRWIGGPERLTNDGGRNPGMALSPDGRQIAFARRAGDTRIWALPFDPVAGRLTGQGEPLTPFGSEAFVVDMSPDGQQLAYRTVRAGREELWVHTVATGSKRLAATEERAQILQPRWSADGRQLAYLRLASTAAADSGVVLVDSRAAVTNQVLPQSRGTTQVYDWAPDGASLLVGCENDHRMTAICVMPSRSDGVRSASLRLIASDSEQHLWSARTSPNKRWITFLATGSPARMIYAMPAGGGTWVEITNGQLVDKPRWSPDGTTIYYAQWRAGSWNLWGRRFDASRGVPIAPPFQVTQLDTPGFAMQVSGLTQLSITRDRLVVPVRESAGGIWVMDQVNR